MKNEIRNQIAKDAVARARPARRESERAALDRETYEIILTGHEELYEDAFPNDDRKLNRRPPRR